MIAQSMKRYDAYKDSGVEWLGEVPEHWSSVRIKNVISKITSGVTPRGGAESYVDVGIPFLRSQNVHNDGLRLNDVSFISSSTHQEMMNSQVKPGDIVFNITGASIARTCIVPESIKTANISQHIALLKLKTSNETKFVSYYLQSQFVTDYVYLTQSGASKEAFNHGQMKCIPLVLPTRPEQNAIANYLDTKTAQIDRKIDLLTQKATQYGKLKQSLINETVTRGLDKTVAMKDSGVEWIGEVPEHWKIKRIKEISEINKRTLSENASASYEFDYVDIGSVTYGTKEFTTEHMTFDIAPSRAKRVVKKGDTIISTVRTYLKAIASIDDDVSDLVVSTGFAVISPNKGLFNKYYSYLFTSDFIVNEICALSTGVSYPATNSSVIGDLFSLVPTYAEQKAIADYLDTKTAYIDLIIETINTQIEKLKELRKTLINDVVTGKIKVVEG